MKKALLSLTCTAALLASAAPARAWTSMSVPGDIYNANTWSPGAQPLPSHSGTVWSGDITVDKNGSFKFAANGSWDTSWGGNGVTPAILRLPATDVGPLTSDGGRDISFGALPGDSPQTLHFSFDDTNLTFSISGSAAPAVSSARLVGAFNDYGDTDTGTLTNTSGSVWTADLPLSSGADLALRVNGDESASWGAPVPVAAAAPLKISLCGNVPANIEDFRPGVFRVTFDASDLSLSVVQLSTNEFTRAGISADGPLNDLWKDRKNISAPQNINLAPDGSVYTGDFWFESKRIFTLSFSERDADGNRGGLYWSAAAPASATIAPDTPWSGTYTAVSSARNVSSNTLTAPVAGFYRISFNPANGLASAQYLYGKSDGVNLFADPSFESRSTPDWGNWYLHNATNYFGSDAPSVHSGNGVAALQQRQTEDGDYGIVSARSWISVSNNIGSTLRVSAWMAAFNGWSPSRTRIWIEFYDADGNKFDEKESILTKMSSSWRPYSLEAEIPEGAVSANLLFSYQGANGGSGELLIDDAEAVITSSRRLTFDSWGKISSKFGAYSPDWSVSWGRTTNNASDLHIDPGTLFISKYIEGKNNNKAVELFNASTAPVNLSGWKLRQYDNGATSPTAEFSLSGTVATGACFLITRTFNDDPIPLDPALKSASDLQFYGLTFNGDDAIVLVDPSGNVADRVGQVRTNVTGSLLAYVMRDHTLVRSSYTSHGTTNAVTADFPYDEWEIRTCDDFEGLKTHSRALPPGLYAPSGLSLVLDEDATLTSKPLDGGIGDVSFWYRTAFPQSAGVSGSATLVVEASRTADFASPTNLGQVVISSTDYSFQQFAVMADLSAFPFFRIRSTDVTGDALARIDDLYVGAPLPTSRYQDFNRWTQPSWTAYVGNYSLGGWALSNGRTTLSNGVSFTPAAVLPQNATVTSPALETGAGTIKFWAVPESADELSCAIAVEKSTDNGVTWNRIGTPFTVTNSTWVSYETSAAVASNAVIRFVSTGANPVIIDNIRIELPEEDSRNQDFNTWPAHSAYQTESHQGWLLSSGAIDTAGGDGNTRYLRLRDPASSIQSPTLQGGLGVLSFSVKPSTADHTAKLKVEVFRSDNSSSVVYSNNIPGSSAPDWQVIQIDVSDETVTKVKFTSMATSSSKQTLCLDSIVCAKILPPPSMSVIATLDPALPYPDESFRFSAFVNPVGGASQGDIDSVTANYKTRVEGRLTPGSIALTNSAGQWFSPELPGLPNGSTVIFSVAVVWTNKGTLVTNFSEQQSVDIDALASGGVWINEVFFTANKDLDSDDLWGATEDHEFVEICGPAGTDLTNWKLEFLLANSAEIARNGGKDLYATYKFAATNTKPASALTLSDSGNGYGFFVVGDPCANWTVNVELNQKVPSEVSHLFEPESESDHIHNGPGIIRLVHGNTVVHSVSYKKFTPGTTSYIEDQTDPWSNTNSISATGGPGWCATNFTWSAAAGTTAGFANAGQSFTNRETTSKTLPQFVFHEPGRIVEPDKASEKPFLMLGNPDNTTNAPTVDARVEFNLAYPAGYPESDCAVYFRHRGETDYMQIETAVLREGALSGTNSFMYWSSDRYAWNRLDTIEYYFSFKPRASSYTIAFVGCENGASTVYASESDAQNHPFSYTFPFHDPIEFTSFVVPADPGARVKAVFFDPDYTKPPENSELALEVLSGSLLVSTNWSKLAPDLDRIYEATNRSVAGDGTYYYLEFDRADSPAFYRIVPSADVP